MRYFGNREGRGDQKPVFNEPKTAKNFKYFIEEGMRR
jgi:hypothetical protein